MTFFRLGYLMVLWTSSSIPLCWFTWLSLIFLLSYVINLKAFHLFSCMQRDATAVDDPARAVFRVGFEADHPCAYRYVYLWWCYAFPIHDALVGLTIRDLGCQKVQPGNPVPESGHKGQFVWGPGDGVYLGKAVISRFQRDAMHSPRSSLHL